MKTILLATALAATFLTTACGNKCCDSKSASNASANSDTVALVSLEELDKTVQTKPANTYVYDANSEESYKEGHIPSSKHMPQSKVAAEALPADKTATLIFYCGSEKCGASHGAAMAAQKLGYTNAKVFKGGLAGWKAAGKSLEK